MNHRKPMDFVVTIKPIKKNDFNESLSKGRQEKQTQRIDFS